MVAGIVVLLAVAAIAVYEYENPPCLGFACGPIPYPVIQGAHAQVGSLGVTNCQLTSDVAVCSIYINGGDSGTVTLNVTNKDQPQGSYIGGTRAQFMVYSSEARYLNFTPIPSCAYTSAPNYDSPSCQIFGNSTQSFQFSFVVSPSYGSSSIREPASVTIVIYKTCCWP